LFKMPFKGMILRLYLLKLKHAQNNEFGKFILITKITNARLDFFFNGRSDLKNSD